MGVSSLKPQETCLAAALPRETFVVAGTDLTKKWQPHVRQCVVLVRQFAAASTSMAGDSCSLPLFRSLALKLHPVGASGADCLWRHRFVSRMSWFVALS